MIPFVGLKNGVHDFEFEISDSFFEAYEYSSITSGNVHVQLSLDKKETMLIGVYTIKGTVSTLCDRCNDPINVPVKGSYKLVYKFGNEEELDESLVVLHPDTYEIDAEPAIYEFTTVSLPKRLVHPQGECNEEMMEILSKYSVNGSEEDDDEDEDWDDDEFYDDEEE
ncbi:MAG: DUF177 domain-containing protein [Bacteroidota bacterium]